MSKIGHIVFQMFPLGILQKLTTALALLDQIFQHLSSTMIKIKLLN